MATRDPGDDSAHEDAFLAIRDSFRAARDELKSYVARLREQNKGERVVEVLNL